MAKAQINGINLYYKEYGQGEALILIPGMGVDHKGWLYQVPVFKRHYRVILFDPRSLGRSERPRQLYDVKTMADDVLGLMDRLGIQRAHIMGHSLGGVVAQEIAVNHPERVIKLILVSSSLGKGEPQDFNPELLEVLGLKEGDTQIDFSRLNVRRTLYALVGMTFNKKSYRKTMQFLSMLFFQPSKFEGLADQLKAVSDYSSRDKISQIKSPTLVITGAEDRLVSPHCSEVLAEKIPNAELMMVPGASHALNIETPYQFNQTILAFLKKA